jgi:hypothetical protein
MESFSHFNRNKLMSVMDPCECYIVISSFVEPKKFISAPAPAPAPAPDSFKDTLKITFFGFSNIINIVTVHKNFFSNHDFFLYNFFRPVVKRKKPEPQFVISAPAPGGNLIRLLGSRIQLRLHNTNYK